MTKKKFAELELRVLQNAQILETNLVIHPIFQRAVESVGSPFLWQCRLAYLNKGPIARQTSQHLPHPVKAPHPQHIPQLSSVAPQLMDQSHPSGDQAHERRFIRHGTARVNF